MSEDIAVRSDCPVALQLLKSKRYFGRRSSGSPLEPTGNFARLGEYLFPKSEMH